MEEKEKVKIPPEHDQDFTGLEEWFITRRQSLEKYFQIAAKAGIRIAYKKRLKTVAIFGDPDENMEEFWEIAEDMDLE